MNILGINLTSKKGGAILDILRVIAIANNLEEKKEKKDKNFLQMNLEKITNHTIQYKQTTKIACKT